MGFFYEYNCHPIMSGAVGKSPFPMTYIYNSCVMMLSILFVD